MKAIILFSGGLDSTVMLAEALSKGRECYVISFDYGQRHKIELEAAKTIASHYKVPHQIIKIDPSYFSQSSLVSQMAVPKQRTSEEIDRGGIPNTYVPARNTLFLAYALGQAELLSADEIHFGANALDCKPYPDCRPEFINAFQTLMNVATKQSIMGHPPKLVAPLLYLDKKAIVNKALELKVPIDLTWSCYDPSPSQTPCQQCDACQLRQAALSFCA